MKLLLVFESVVYVHQAGSALLIAAVGAGGALLSSLSASRAGQSLWYPPAEALAAPLLVHCFDLFLLAEILDQDLTSGEPVSFWSKFLRTPGAQIEKLPDP